MKSLACLSTLFFLSLFLIIANAQIPGTLSYQGFLSDGSGTKLNGAFNISFNIYDNIFSSTPVWTENQNVEIVQGYLNVYLGTKTSFASAGLKFDKPYYLGIKIESNEEFAKTPLSAVPYSFSASTIIPKNAQEGWVLTYKDSQVQWLAPQTSSGEGISSNTVVNTADPALQITQNGTGSVLELQKPALLSITTKKGESPQNVLYDICDELTGTSGYSLTINSKTCNGIMVTMANENNSEETEGLDVYNQGLGRAADFLNVNPNNQKSCVWIRNLGTGQALLSIQEGLTGDCGYFSIPPSLATGNCVKGVNEAKGSAGYFMVTNQGNSSSALVGYSLGTGNAISGYIDNTTGHAGSFIIQNNNNQGASLSAYSNGSDLGTAIYAKSSGLGRAASFESNSGATQPTLYASTCGEFEAAYFTSSSESNALMVTESDTRISNQSLAYFSAMNGGTAISVISTESKSDPAMVITKNGNNSNIALQVNGSIDCNGSISKKSGSFVIDHPLDPENKELCHSFVESPDMKNIYDGIAVLDENGEASVELPNWFEALNKDFRYQLTCIGGYAQVYISEEISNNKFKIGGGTPGMKISWQVTGIRHDTWAVEHPVIVEREKVKHPVPVYSAQVHDNTYKHDLNLLPGVNIEQIKAQAKTEKDDINK